jgi:hypothetical protein
MKLLNSMGESQSENRASSDPDRAPRGPWLVRAAGALAVLVLIFVGAEGAVRVEDRVHWGMPLFSPDTAVGDLLVSDQLGMHPIPGATFRKWHINSVGTRGPEPVTSRSDERVLTLGASETMGLYESADREYARQLADSLDANHCAGDVLNAGFVGMSLPTVEQDFRLRLATLHPRVAVYYPTPPQYLDDRLPRAVHLDSSGTSRPPTHGFHSRFLPRLRDQVKSLVPRFVLDRMRRSEIAGNRSDIPTDSIFATVPPERLAAFDHDLRRLVGSVRAAGTTPILVTHANAFTGAPPAAGDRLNAWVKFYPRATGATLVAFDSAAAIVTRQVAADSGVALVDAWQHFHGVRSDSMFADFSHFTDHGSADMASLLEPAVASALHCGGTR